MSDSNPRPGTVIVVNHQADIVENFLRLLTQGSSNDIKFKLSDGELMANKDILAAQSDYFATMFSNKDSKEVQENEINMDYCHKATLFKLFKYLFTGKMIFDFPEEGFPIVSMLHMMNLSRMMLFDKLYSSIESRLLKLLSSASNGKFSAEITLDGLHTVTDGPDGKFGKYLFGELCQGLQLVENLKLASIKDALVGVMYNDLKVLDTCNTAVRHVHRNAKGNIDSQSQQND